MDELTKLLIKLWRKTQMMSIEIRINGQLLHYLMVKNISELAEISDYDVRHIDENQHVHWYEIVGHQRSDGALALAKMVIDKAIDCQPKNEAGT